MAVAGGYTVTEDQIRFDRSAEERLYQALHRFWHPVAYASQLTDDKPLAAVLLGEQIVLTRLDGRVQAFRDLCVHRGTALSLGWIEDNALRCAYHGWKYGPDGMCTEIPSRFGTRIPPRARLTRYEAAEAAGLIWVCLSGPPRYPLPEFPQRGGPGFRIIEVESYDWDCSMPRRIENYVDFAHFAWVHDGVLGDRSQPEVPDHAIERAGCELRFDHPGLRRLLPESGGPDRAGREKAVDVLIEYRLFMPNTVLLDHRIPALDQQYLLFFTVCPTGPKTSRCFTLQGRDYSHDEETDRELREFNALVIGQDLPIVQSQRPEELPMDLSAEIQIKGADQVAVEYRRWLKEIADGVDAA